MFNWLNEITEKFVEKILNIDTATRLGSSLNFFFYDVIKIIIMLSVMIFIISYIRSYFSPEKTRKVLERFKGIKGNIMASLLGIVTPFCSCSSVPLFIGFVEAGIPLGVTFSFLITSPIVNEAGVAFLVESLGWKIAILYVETGVLGGVTGGIIIQVLKMEKQVEEYVYNIKVGQAESEELDFKGRIRFSVNNVADIVRRIWIFLLIGIGIGALIHGWAPETLLAKYAGPDNPVAVIVAVVFAVPLYSNALGTIPIAEALIYKGVGMGTALSFMMATTALSLPEMILLRKVIKPKLISVFVFITGVSIIFVGYFFNLIV